MTKKFLWKRLEELDGSRLAYVDYDKHPDYHVMKLVSEGIGSDTAIVVDVLKPGDFIATHEHEDIGETYILVKGKSVVLVGKEEKIEERIDAEAFSFFYFPVNCLHGVYNNSNEDAVWILTSPYTDELRRRYRDPKHFVKSEKSRGEYFWTI